MSQLIHLIWYINMLVLIFFILRQEPKLKGINNLTQREKGFSLSSTTEKLRVQQTWGLIICFVILTTILTKIQT
uniref:preprotein translocase subunit G n=1 Tax=Rhodaphanes brevistipitata TaxID=446136 RepID=UPI001FCDAC0B|nr:preprotein translocase subunit G [Rhodaphanes brevistipitata]UNJ18513.1 preprotein translocase subunit G [Rhodaphanes brevistipitata]